MPTNDEWEFISTHLSEHFKTPRNPERIPIIMSALERFWTLVPDWRFCQLIANITYARDSHGNCEDIFFLEDDKFLQKLEQFAKEHFPKGI